MSLLLPGLALVFGILFMDDFPGWFLFILGVASIIAGCWLEDNGFGDREYDMIWL